MELAPAPAKAALAPVSMPKPDKPIQVAMRLTTEVGEKPVAIDRQASVRKDATAKLEKRSIPLSGKVKLRDLIRNLGGILLWDAKSHSVTVCLPELKIEMEIGSQLVKVNGTEMGVDNPPVLVNGRTIIDVDVYHLACHVAGLGVHLASAR